MEVCTTPVKIRPVWWIGVVVWPVYHAIIHARRAADGADYTDLAGRTEVAEPLVLPELLGATLIIAVVSWLG